MKTERTRRGRLGSIGAYCYIWLMVGFFSGTPLLVGPVRLLTSTLRSRGWSERIESVLRRLGTSGLDRRISMGRACFVQKPRAGIRLRRSFLRRENGFFADLSTAI